MSHSNQVREYRITDRGVELIPAYIGPEGVLTGAARLSQEAREQAAAASRRQEVERRRRDLARRRAVMERQIIELRAALEAAEDETDALAIEDDARETALTDDRAALALRRGAA